MNDICFVHIFLIKTTMKHNITIIAFFYGLYCTYFESLQKKCLSISFNLQRENWVFFCYRNLAHYTTLYLKFEHDSKRLNRPALQWLASKMWPNHWEWLATSPGRWRILTIGSWNQSNLRSNVLLFSHVRFSLDSPRAICRCRCRSIPAT